MDSSITPGKNRIKVKKFKYKKKYPIIFFFRLVFDWIDGRGGVYKDQSYP